MTPVRSRIVAVARAARIAFLTSRGCERVGCLVRAAGKGRFPTGSARLQCALAVRCERDAIGRTVRAGGRFGLDEPLLLVSRPHGGDVRELAAVAGQADG